MFASLRLEQHAFPITPLRVCLHGAFSRDIQFCRRVATHSRSADFTQCQADIRNRTLSYEPYWIDIYGRRTFNVSEAIGTDKGTCMAYCGSSPSPFQWGNFSPQFTGWLLPFLALTAQLPYESNGIWHNLMCLLLTVGSPSLAMYSLALTLLNSRYAKQLLHSLPIPKDPEERLQFNELKSSIFQTFRVSQQELFAIAIRETSSSGDFAMMRAWWRSVHQSLVKSSRWFTASLTTQAAWAIIAFAFTWIDAFGSSKIGTKVTAHGLSIALCWSWVVVIVLGWFFAGVSFSSSPLTDAIEQADDAYPGALPRLVAYERPRDRQDRYHFVFTRRIAGDVEYPGPIYNYARVLVWSHMTYHMVEAIRHQMSRPRILLNQEQNPAPKQDRPQQQDQYEQEKQYEQHENQMGRGRLSLRTRAASDVHTSITLVTSPTSVQGSKDEQGTLSQNNVFEREEGIPIITRYLWEDARGSARWKHDAYSRMAWATVCAITLSVMTVGSAFGLDFSTPSVGLGCRSGGVLIYWMVSYIILIVMVLAALISDQWSAHEAKVRQYQTQVTSLHRATSRVLGILAVSLRLFGKLLACANSVWIILHCLFEFTSFYDRCYCLTNRGTTFWLWFDDARIRSSGHTGRFWVGFASATGFTCLFYIAFMLAWTTKRL